MPTRRGAIDAIDAGFSPEWFERSLGDATLYSLRDHGRDYPSRILPLAMSIMSESRQPDDAWANGVEAQWNALVDKYSPQDPTLISRTYCNAHGCLLYTDTEQPTRAADGKVLVDFLDGKPSPAQQFGIAPRNVFRAGNFLWFLTVIERPK